MIDLGYKYNMDNIHAALLINQLDRLDSYWERRRVLYSYNKEKLSRIPNVQFPKIVEQAKSAYHLFTIWVPTAYRDNIMWKLQQEGIGIAVNFRSITDMSYYNRCVSNKLRNAQRIGNSTISLPFYPRLTFAEIDYISDVLNIIMKEYEEIRA
jgi:dTDP-4-amino-4,6-dideoxygalactose transaminase